MRLLLVEDKDSFRRLLVQALGPLSGQSDDPAWEVTAVGDPAAALEALASAPYGILVTDLRLPGMSGLELLKAAKRRHPALRAVLMSAFGEPKDIVEAMRWGADDFLPKPFDLDQFGAVLERLRALAEAPPPDPREPWVAHSPAMRALDQGLAKAADTGFAVLFQGEAGAGKGRAARRLHVLRHPQAPYLCLSGPSLPPEGPDPRLLALLQGGSLYVSELEEIAPAGCAELVRAMDGPLGQGVHWMGGCGRLEALPEMLRLRMGVISFSLPPLRERREDILPMFRCFLESRARQDGRPVPMLEHGTEKELLQGAWPGNLGQMAWAVASAWRATAGPVLAPLPSGMPGAPAPALRGHAGDRQGAPYPGPERRAPGPATPPPGMPERRIPPEAGALVLPWPVPGALEAMLASVEREAEGALVRRALGERPWDPAQVARELGLSPRRFAGVLRAHRISLEDE
ncbi:MAG: response regulator [Holophaga sp.]|jgi:DNA-binding NtrC family response regulator